ncbi:CAAX protease self-immunity family protein [Ochrobactrum quorumnocens]|uniref:CAAX protease self-immunity family protein n=1 Tax=Ochrobactrum quorumnocens TaxID=271865 RepID=A0A248UIM6_9HYPH|nr:type II CAAX endopeptidase family protein [[Ochrobactrum] quorumnocens]ASV86534.1 CAAX protease self-immunity family protein [[Ochrobactrum] quorumnocens]
MITDDRWQRPGWPEILIGLVAYAVLLVSFGLLMGLLPSNDPVVLGVVGSTAGGFVGVGAFTAAYSLRIRNLRSFGFRPVSPRWLLIATGVGIIGYGINLIIQFAYLAWFGSSDPQGILHAAARGGPLPFLLSFLGGAIFTPFGEEILFRGVVANAVNRYGAFAGIVLSAIIFGLAHGVGVILPVAIMVGILSAILFRATGSVWPCVILHCVYNGANSFASAMRFSPMQ